MVREGPQLLTDTIFPGSAGSARSAGSGGSGEEFLTPDSARDILSILALGGLAGGPNNKKPNVFYTFLLQPLKNLRKIKDLCLWGPCPKAKGVLAGPGTPRDPKSDVFVTKWVAIQPFGTFYARLDAEFRPGARQIGPTPSISSFLSILDPQIWKVLSFNMFSMFFCRRPPWRA